MRVLAITNLYPTPESPASGVFIAQQIQSLRSRGIEVEVIFADRRREGPLVYYRMGPALRRKVAEFDPDIVHVMYGGVMAAQVTAQPRQPPTIVNFHGSDLLGENLSGIGRKIISRYGVYCSKKAARRAQGVIVVARDLLKVLDPALDAAKIRVIPCGIDLERFKPLDRRQCQEQLGWSSSKFHILFVSSSGDPVKRPELARSAVARLEQKRESVQFHMLSGVSNDKVPVWLNASDVLLVTSKHEGSPTVVKEALASGLPIVSVPVGDIPERIAGVAGCYLAEPDLNDLAEKLDSAYQRRERLDCRDKLQKLSCGAVAATIEEFYGEVLRRCGSESCAATPAVVHRNDSVAAQPIGGFIPRERWLQPLFQSHASSPNGDSLFETGNGSPSPGPEQFTCEARKAETNSAGGWDSTEQPTGEAVTKQYLQSEPADGSPSPGGEGWGEGELPSQLNRSGAREPLRGAFIARPEMNWRRPTYLAYASLRGYRFPSLLRRYLAEYERGIDANTNSVALSRLLLHCRESVPYYASLLSRKDPRKLEHDPRGVLQSLPVLTKDLIRANFSGLQSKDNERRNCEFNTSGGSTGEPVQLIQDDEYRDASTALRWLSQHQLGCALGQPSVRLWGSERDLEAGTKSRKARFFNWLTNTSLVNAFAMSPGAIRNFITMLNRKPPRLIVAYAQAAYEVARFAEREQVPIKPQHAIMTSAGTLYPFMRHKIREIFGCEVYNLYGSREVSDIAWELPGFHGLWAPPWANFLEIVDEEGCPVPAGTEGNILVTCLTNYAMPLLRYSIGDRGALLPGGQTPPGVQALSHVSGRTVDTFRRSDHTLVDGEYFTHLLYFRPWVSKFQVVQKSHAHLLFKVVSANGNPPEEELDEIAGRSRLAMGTDCRVDFEFCDELPPLPSGKFRYTISEVTV